MDCLPRPPNSSTKTNEPRSGQSVLHGVAPHEAVPANVDEIAEHSQAVANHMYLCCWIVRPADRHLDPPQPVPLGEEENLRIEAEAFDPLLFKHNTRGRPHKRFESALRVVIPQPGKKPHEPVEDDSRKLARTGLAHENLGTVGRAGADRNVIARTY